MKKIAILAALALVFVCASCDKSKTCKCTVTGGWDIPGMTMNQESTGTIEKGECSDLNTRQTMDDGDGHTYESVTECVEI